MPACTRRLHYGRRWWGGERADDELCSTHEQEPEALKSRGQTCCSMHALMQLLQWSLKARPTRPFTQAVPQRHPEVMVAA